MLDVSNYTYNKAIAEVNSGATPNFYALRTQLVTSQTRTGNNEYHQLMSSIKELIHQKKHASTEAATIMEEQITELRRRITKIPYVKNESIQEWELKIPKEVRAGAVHDVAKAYKTAMANLKAGNIRFFHLGFRDSTNKSCVIPKQALQNVNGVITMFPKCLNMLFAMGARNMKKYHDLKIMHDVRLIKKQHKYYLIIPVSSNKREQIKQPVNYVGVDPGVRTFMTAFGNNGCIEYEHDNSVFTKLNNKLYKLKARKKRTRKRTRKDRKDRKASERKATMLPSGEASRLLGCRSLRSQKGQKGTRKYPISVVLVREKHEKNNQYLSLWSDRSTRKTTNICSFGRTERRVMGSRQNNQYLLFLVGQKGA